MFRFWTRLYVSLLPYVDTKFPPVLVLRLPRFSFFGARDERRLIYYLLEEEPPTCL